MILRLILDLKLITETAVRDSTRVGPLGACLDHDTSHHLYQIIGHAQIAFLEFSLPVEGACYFPDPLPLLSS